MIKDLLVSFKDNIKQKTTNPFLGTLIIVWIIHNYSNLYKLLFSSDNIVFKDKTIILDNLFLPSSFLPNLIECILVSLIALISTYLLLNISRLIINFYEKIITPWVYKITDKSSIVLKYDYELLRNERDKIQKRFEEEREKRLRLESEVENLENRVKKLQNPENVEIEIVKDDNEKYMQLLNKRGYLSIFEELIFSINAKEYVKEEEGHRFLVTLGLIKRTDAGNEFSLFAFTDKGLSFEEYYRNTHLFSDYDEK